MAINHNENLLRRIVRAVDKAISEDVPEYLQNHPLETNNAAIQMRGDFINENLRQFAVSENVALIPFKRFSWHGRLLVDYANKATYSVTTQNNLYSIPRKKGRKRPHFLQSLLANENKELQGMYIQEELFSTDPFDDETYEHDYNDIVAGRVNQMEGFRHYIIAYTTYGRELVDIKLLLLDRYFNIVDEFSLNEYIIPDFAKLTSDEVIEQANEEMVVPNVRGLLGIKAGIRPAIKKVENEA